TPALIAKASSTHLARMQPVMKDYATALNGLLQPPVVDMDGVTQRDQLQPRKELVRKFMAANDKLQNFVVNRNKLFREDLNQAGVPAEELDAAVMGYTRISGQQDGLI